MVCNPFIFSSVTDIWCCIMFARAAHRGALYIFYRAIFLFTRAINDRLYIYDSIKMFHVKHFLGISVEKVEIKRTLV
jgi:hypothetical protein